MIDSDLRAIDTSVRAEAEKTDAEKSAHENEQTTGTHRDEKSVRANEAKAHDNEPSANLKLDPSLDPNKAGGYGLGAADDRLGAQDHHQAKGDAKDSQYGASPARDIRYRDGTSGTYGQGNGAGPKQSD